MNCFKEFEPPKNSADAVVSHCGHTVIKLVEILKEMRIIIFACTTPKQSLPACSSVVELPPPAVREPTTAQSFEMTNNPEDANSQAVFCGANISTLRM